MILVADTVTSTVYIADTLALSDTAKYVSVLCTYVKARAQKVGGELANWSQVTAQSTVQTDSNSCGVLSALLTMMNAESIIKTRSTASVKPDSISYYLAW